MLKGFLKAARLEFNQIKESKITLLLLFLVPVIVVSIFAIFGESNSYLAKILTQQDMRSRDFFAPPLLVIIILFITTQLTILRIVGERSPYGTLDRDLLAISRGGMYLGKLLTNTMIGFLQSFLMFLTILVFGIRIDGNSISVLLTILATAFMGLNMGLMFSVFSKNKEQAIQLVPSSLVALLILSGIFIQFTEIPEIMRPIATASPLGLSYNALSKIMLSIDHTQISPTTPKSYRIIDVMPEIGGILGWAFVFLAAGLVKFKLEGR